MHIDQRLWGHVESVTGAVQRPRALKPPQILGYRGLDKTSGEDGKHKAETARALGVYTRACVAFHRIYEAVLQTHPTKPQSCIPSAQPIEPTTPTASARTVCHMHVQQLQHASRRGALLSPHQLTSQSKQRSKLNREILQQTLQDSPHATVSGNNKRTSSKALPHPQYLNQPAADSFSAHTQCVHSLRWQEPRRHSLRCRHTWGREKDSCSCLDTACTFSLLLQGRLQNHAGIDHAAIACPSQQSRHKACPLEAKQAHSSKACVKAQAWIRRKESMRHA